MRILSACQETWDSLHEKQGQTFANSDLELKIRTSNPNTQAMINERDLESWMRSSGASRVHGLHVKANIQPTRMLREMTGQNADERLSDSWRWIKNLLKRRHRIRARTRISWGAIKRRWLSWLKSNLLIYRLGNWLGRHRLMRLQLIRIDYS